jgi:hypothetical protein
MSNNQFSFKYQSTKFNTRSIGTSNRTASAVRLGCLKGGSMGSISRIYKWCNNHTTDPIACVFKQFEQPPALPVSKSSWINISSVPNLNLGVITGNIGSNGQIILGGSNGRQLQFSTDLGNSWAPYNNSPNLPFQQMPWSSVVMSDNTSRVIGVPYLDDNHIVDLSNNNGIYFTSNGGNNWTLVQQCNLFGGGTLVFNTVSYNLLFIDAGISQDGQYMAALTTPRSNSTEPVYLIFSNDTGFSWTAYLLNPSYGLVTPNATSISIANTIGSDYFLITSDLYYNNTSQNYENGTCCVSNNGGTTFTSPSDVSGNDFIYSSLSDSGQYQVFVTATNPQSVDISIPSRLYLSSNSGTSFTKIIQLTYTDDNNYLVFGGVSMSANGQYITASVLDQDGILQYIYVSSDIGVTWNKIYNDSDGSPFSLIQTINGFGFLNTNYSGQYQMLSGANILYISNNYGN